MRVHIERRYVLQIGMLLLILATVLLAGCVGNAEESATTTEIDEEATELAQNGGVEERATTAIEESVDELQRDDDNDADATVATTATAVVTGTTSAETQQDMNTVQVELTEFEIRMPTTVPAGMTQFQVTNVGTAEHSFVIEDGGTEVALEDHVQVGETKRLEVELSPGTYTVYCPVAEHRENGMRLEVEVTANE